jgi:predicted metal-dependent enzyme (double-stranded beta helix superfamily)
LGALLDDAVPEPQILARGGQLLLQLVEHDDWLPDEYAAPSPERYQQYLLHCDSRERFSVVSFVWGPGQSTPVHDHTVWGLIGVLRGAELGQAYTRSADGTLAKTGESERLVAGAVAAVSPSIGDIHQVSNAVSTTSVSIHVYGANIGRVERSTYAADGQPKRFVSGYANRAVPNIWGQG